MIYQKKMEINIMAIDATFWVAVSFVIFFGGLNLFKNTSKN
jgi:F-type H+-transporting ATPase subunit b